MSRTIAYIDAFNLHYGCLKGTPYRWLDVHALCENALPRDSIDEIKYFTAEFDPRKRGTLQEAQNQQIYHRALRTIPNLSIILGHFLTHTVSMRLAQSLPDGTRFVPVLKTEEKGSDVNIATELLMDGFNSRYDLAIVVSGDSDLLRPIQRVMEELKKPVGVLNPQTTPCHVLQQQATFYKHIFERTVRRSLFPTLLTDSGGQFMKPAGW